MAVTVTYASLVLMDHFNNELSTVPEVQAENWRPEGLCVLSSTNAD